MQKTVYVIPGYSERTTYKRYKKTLQLFRSSGFDVIPVEIKWKNRTITEYVDQFLKTYKPVKGCYLFGFSFGSIIALISAPKIKPKAIVLCSLSPYFREDLPEIRKIFGKKLYKYFREKDFRNLNKYSFPIISRKIKSRTILVAGDKEVVIRGKNYPIVLDRAKDAKKRIKGSRLIVVKNGKHDISQKEYFNAIKRIVYKL